MNKPCSTCPDPAACKRTGICADDWTLLKDIEFTLIEKNNGKPLQFATPFQCWICSAPVFGGREICSKHTM